jgi:hypothetical protein
MLQLSKISNGSLLSLVSLMISEEEEDDADTDLFRPSLVVIGVSKGGARITLPIWRFGRKPRIPRKTELNFFFFLDLIFFLGT